MSQSNNVEGRESGRSGASALFGGGTCDIPPDVATCPECGSKMYAECVEWDMETGTPTTTGIMVNCVADDEEMEHRYWQSDWQPIIDAAIRKRRPGDRLIVCKTLGHTYLVITREPKN